MVAAAAVLWAIQRAAHLAHVRTELEGQVEGAKATIAEFEGPYWKAPGIDGDQVRREIADAEQATRRRRQAPRQHRRVDHHHRPGGCRAPAREHETGRLARVPDDARGDHRGAPARPADADAERQERRRAAMVEAAAVAGARFDGGQPS